MKSQSQAKPRGVHKMRQSEQWPPLWKRTEYRNEESEIRKVTREKKTEEGDGK